MARKQSKPEVREPEDEAPEMDLDDHEEEGEGAATSTGANGKAVNKSQAARAAIEEGYQKPIDAVAYIKSRYGIEMTPQHFSAIKSNQNKKAGAAPAKRGPKPRSASVEGYLSPPARSNVGLGESELLMAMEAVKPLISSIGADKLKRIVDLMS